MRMVFHMKTTWTIDDGVLKRLKREAALRRCTMSELVESALRRLLRIERASASKPPSLPTWNSGGALVDVSDREALFSAMER